jgi:anthranilate phosphoribosyltransferase
MSGQERGGDLRDVLEAIGSGRALSAEEAEATFDAFMSGSAS